MHICCILHRRFAGQNRRTAKLWLVGGCWVLFGSLSELAIMGVLWSKAWSLWHLPMKIFMPILHFGESDVILVTSGRCRLEFVERELE